MQKWLCVLLAAILWGGFGAALTATAVDQGLDTIQNGKAVSLKVLQKRLQQHLDKKAIPAELLELAGLNRILGYVVDEANHDLILIGQSDPNLPPLYLDDLVVALRNAWLKYAVLKGNTYYYANPGCSIEMQPKVLSRLQQVGDQIGRGSNEAEVDQVIEVWHQTCRSPQQVLVLGIPFDTRFAWVMVKADYDMKRLVDGSDNLNLPHFVSLGQMRLEEAQAAVLEDRPLSGGMGMNRFWFHPGENSYLEEKGVVLLEKCPVILLTEEEHLDRKGERRGKGQPNPLAQRFTEQFTSLYNQIAQQRPVYLELENLFRFVALAKILKFKNDLEQAGLDLGYLMQTYPVAQVPVSPEVPGCSRVQRFVHEKQGPQVIRTARLWLPSCGGVGIEIAVSHKNFKPDTEKRCIKTREQVLLTRPAPEAFSWTFSYSNIAAGRYKFSFSQITTSVY